MPMHEGPMNDECLSPPCKKAWSNERYFCRTRYWIRMCTTSRWPFITLRSMRWSTLSLLPPNQNTICFILTTPRLTFEETFFAAVFMDQCWRATQSKQKYSRGLTASSLRLANRDEERSPKWVCFCFLRTAFKVLFVSHIHAISCYYNLTILRKNIDKMKLGERQEDE